MVKKLKTQDNNIGMIILSVACIIFIVILVLAFFGVIFDYIDNFTILKEECWNETLDFQPKDILKINPKANQTYEISVGIISSCLNKSICGYRNELYLTTCEIKEVKEIDMNSYNCLQNKTNSDECGFVEFYEGLIISKKDITKEFLSNKECLQSNKDSCIRWKIGGYEIFKNGWKKIM